VGGQALRLADDDDLTDEELAVLIADDFPAQAPGDSRPADAGYL